MFKEGVRFMDVSKKSSASQAYRLCLPPAHREINTIYYVNKLF